MKNNAKRASLVSFLKASFDPVLVGFAVYLLWIGDNSQNMLVVPRKIETKFGETVWFSMMATGGTPVIVPLWKTNNDLRITHRVVTSSVHQVFVLRDWGFDTLSGRYRVFLSTGEWYRQGDGKLDEIGESYVIIQGQRIPMCKPK